MSDTETDVIVIGGGPVGENVAQYATENSGLRATLVEGELLGGECSYYACIPSKALLRPIDVATTATHLGGLTAPALDRAGLLARRDSWVSHYDDAGQLQWATGAGLQVLRGHGQLVAERTVQVGEQLVTARHAVVLATGSQSVIPAGYQAAQPWTSRDVTGVVEVPDRLVIIGGGVVACEAATWMNALGSRVTLLVRGARLLGQLEPFAGEAVAASLHEAGVDVRFNANVEQCERQAAADTGLGRIHGGPVRLTTDSGELVADELLIATGRRPRLDDVGLDRVGLSSDDVLAGHLPDWLLVVGDASGEAPLTHWGKYRARVIGEQIAARAQGQPIPVVPEHVPVPQVVFTDPQVAAVGLTQARAEEAGHSVVTSNVPFTAAAGAALLRDDATGAAQLVVDTPTHRLLGATFVGPEVADLVHAATVAIVGQVPVGVLRHAVPSYPTASELWLRLLEALPHQLRS